jgi:hypothetical protein
MRPSKKKTEGFAVCVENDGYAAALEVRKLYPVLSDPEAEAQSLIRVIDESGEDYLYPIQFFKKVKLPAELLRALRIAS